MQFSLFAVGAACIVVLIFSSDVLDGLFSGSGGATPPAHQPALTEASASDIAAAIPGFADEAPNHTVAAELEHLDPAGDAWDSEVFAEAALDQLKRLGEHLTDRSKLAPAQLAGLAAPSFACGPLRPVLKEAFHDGGVHVRRATNEHDEPTPASTLTGPEALAAALRDLTEPFSDTRGPRTAFKIFRVAEEGDFVATTAYYQAVGESKSGTLGQHAIWQARWTRGESDAPPKLVFLTARDFEEVTVDDAAKPALADCTEAVLGANACYGDQLLRGTDDWQSRLDGSFGVDVAALEGLALGDVNGDGLDDVYLCQGGGRPNRLFLHHSDGTAQDVSAAAGVDWQDLTRAALFVDWDNDGDQDLVIAAQYKVLLMANDGGGRFDLKTTWRARAELFSLAAADYDRDGDLDVYVCARSDADGAFRQGALGAPVPYHDANNGAANTLLENDGDWRVRDVTREVGLDVNNRRFSYAASWEDYDDDGDPDLYVANDFGRNNLYRNDGGRFVDTAAEADVEDMAAGMSVAWGDYNRDGRMDLYVSNMFSSAGERITYQRRFQDDLDDATRAQFQRHARGNTLFENIGGGAFRDVSEQAGVTMGRWAWGSTFVDLNNDGYEDLYVANGFITGRDEHDL